MEHSFLGQHLCLLIYKRFYKWLYKNIHIGGFKLLGVRWDSSLQGTSLPSKEGHTMPQGPLCLLPLLPKSHLSLGVGAGEDTWGHREGPETLGGSQ